MIDFSWLKEISSIDDNKEWENDGKIMHRFFALKSEEIIKQEKRLGCSFPPELRALYMQIGWGGLCAKNHDSIDEIIHPEELTDIILKEGCYEGAQDDNIESRDRKIMFPFFYVGDQLYFCLDLTKEDNEGRSPVVDPNEVDDGYTLIADSLDDFIRKMSAKVDFYDDIFEEEWQKINSK